MEVRFIPATKSKIKTELRVAAYARVSDAKDAMLNSLESQIDYYNNRIEQHKGWRLIKVFSDKGLTGTKENRPGFQEMLKVCRNGEVDMVVTKAISRFARNTVTLLETVRELKALGIDVYFEKEEIHTLSGDGEVMISILASFAQAESLSVSENCKWRIRKGFKEGKANGLTMLGYRLNTDGSFRVVPEDAEIVRFIYNSYLEGRGKDGIIKELLAKGYKPRRGGSWTSSGIHSILTNEKYTGTLLLQKYYRENHITKKKRSNKDELPKYLIENHHSPIIDKATFDLVQKELVCRHRSSPQKEYAFKGLLICGCCGKHYNLKKKVWMCSTFSHKGKIYCPTAKQIPADILENVTRKVLKINECTQKNLLETLCNIIVPGPNKLRYVFLDGREIEKKWEDISKRDSWTDEMKEEARRRSLMWKDK